MDRLRRLDALLLLALPAVYATLVFAGDFRIDPDSYYHMGCARLYASRGWLGDFPWLPYTVLGPGFPNVHFLQHLALAPVAPLGVDGIKLACVLLPTALFFSVYLFLRRRGVPGAAAWTVLGALGSTLFVTISITIKGAATFAILLVWLADALLRRAGRRAFVLAWLTAYAYVGASILLPLVFVLVAVRWLWDGERDWRSPAWVVGGLVCGMIVNPFWPDHWWHVGAELWGAFHRPKELVPGIFRGGEWLSINGADTLRYAGAFMAAFAVLFVRHLGGRARVPADAAALAVSALGLLVAGMVAAKFFHLFFVVSLLALPVLCAAQRPWPAWAAPLALGAGLAVAVVSVRASWRDIAREEERSPGPDAYRALGEFLEARTQEGQVVVTPWDDFPGIFFFDTKNRYVSGMNNDFLRRASEKRFRAFVYLYDGQVRDPENLLPTFFDGARHVVTRRPPRNDGEKRLVERLAKNPRFAELPSPAPFFRVWELRPPATAPPVPSAPSAPAPPAP